MQSNIKKTILLFILNTSLACFGQNNSNAYFQQIVYTKIDAELFPDKELLRAKEEIQYINQSKVKIDTIYLHVWANGYKDPNTAYFKELARSKNNYPYNHASDFQGNCSIKKLSQNRIVSPYEWDKEYTDILILPLKETLSPNDTLIIDIDFEVKIPLLSSRMGHSYSDFALSQWFPKPAVFDQKGWHAFPYLNQGEFYSEFGSYNVKITVPEAYQVAATGNLKQVQSEEHKKTYEFAEDSIHDFAWFAGTNWTISKDSVQLPHSGRWVQIECYYNANHTRWNKAHLYVKDAIYYYSLWLGDYPYATCKVVEGLNSSNGGMEYPTITTIEPEITDSLALETVIIHEVGHNWFYGILASNEREFPWMDEGLNSAYEFRYLETKYPKLFVATEGYFQDFINEMDHGNRVYSDIVIKRNIDQSGHLHSSQYSNINYGSIVYKKNADIFNYLRSYLGDIEFDRIMKIYFEKWKFKHPQPEDLYQIFETESHKPIDWAFEDLLQTRKIVDYKVSKIKHKGSESIVTFKNNGQISSPLFFSIFKDGKKLDDYMIDGFKNDTTITISHSFDYLIIDPNQLTLDINQRNNYFRNAFLFKHTKNLSIRPLTDIVKPGQTTIFFSPTLGYNTPNGLMVGTAFMSNLLFPSRFDFLFMPMWAFGNHQLTGEAELNYYFRSPKNWLKQIKPFVHFKSYAISSHLAFYKYSAGIQFDLQNFMESNPAFKQFEIKYVHSNEPTNPRTYRDYYNINYTIKQNRSINGYQIAIKNTFSEQFGLTKLEYRQTLSYNKLKTGLHLRWFGGFFWYNQTNSGLYNLKLSGHTGMEDYQYENTFIERNRTATGAFSQQFAADDGGFAYYAPFSSNRWLTSLNISSSLPFRSPFEVYFNMAAFSGSKDFFENGLAWESGVSVSLLRQLFVIYFPLWAHESIINANELNINSPREKIRFTVNFSFVNVRTMSRNIDQYL